MTPKRHTGTTDILMEKVVTIDRSPRELYRFWREMENLPLFMLDLDEAKSSGEDRYRFTSILSDGRKVQWEVRILDEAPEQTFSWASLPDAEVDAHGAVCFTPAPGNRGTEVRVILKFAPPTSTTLKEFFWNIFGEDPASHLEQSLRRLQQLMETGEIARSGARGRRMGAGELP